MLVIGAKGFAKEVLGVLDQLGMTQNLFFYDSIDIETDLLYSRFPILHNPIEVKELFKKDNQFTLGIGNPSLRLKFYNEFIELGGELVSTISPNTHISRFDVNIDKGVNIITGAIIDNSVTIDKGCIINTASIIGHDSILEEFVEVCPGVVISGGCHVGKFTFIGSNATILPRVKIGKNCIIGAGAVVINDIEDNMTVLGIPAKPLIIKKA
jgi:sugar O-acyltransferase (sialic acid O-acetyltransferase NeuD family)